MKKTFGPDVACDYTQNVESTQRLGDTGPFFCMACGSIAHLPA